MFCFINTFVKNLFFLRNSLLCYGDYYSIKTIMTKLKEDFRKALLTNPMNLVWKLILVWNGTKFPVRLLQPRPVLLAGNFRTKTRVVYLFIRLVLSFLHYKILFVFVDELRRIFYVTFLWWNLLSLLLNYYS